MLREDSQKLAASNLHELMRCWENTHRMWQAEAHVRTVLFREETRWPGYYFRADKPALDEEKWHVFANCRFDPQTNAWGTRTRPIGTVVMVAWMRSLIGVLAAFIALSSIGGGIAMLAGSTSPRWHGYETRLSAITPFPHSFWRLSWEGPRS